MTRTNRFLQLIVFSLLFAFVAQDLFCDSFRVKKVNIVNTTNDITRNADIVKIGMNEAIAISIPEDKTFIEGLEIKFDIPEELASWRDSVACTIYASISPSPSPAKIDYSGTRAYVQTLPGKLSWILQIPFNENVQLKTNQYTTISDPITEIKDNFIFLRLQPVMKGIPEEVMNAKITASIKPLFINKGKLWFNIKGEDENIQPCSVFIDDQSVIGETKTSALEYSSLLDTGIHNISIISEFYRNEVRTVRIDRAKNTKLELVMKSIEPAIVVTAPDGATVYLDDELFTKMGEEVQISEGEHKFKLILGDYEILKTLQILKGKTYKLNLSVDLQISEE